jgi:hypothetical protein
MIRRLQRNSQSAASRFVLFTKYYLYDQVMEGNMGWTGTMCDTEDIIVRKTMKEIGRSQYI